MTIRRCARCQSPTPSGRHTYCGDACAFEAFVQRERRRGHFSTLGGYHAEFEARKRRPADPAYGSKHQKLRARWALKVDRGGVLCARCGQPIHPGTPWHLDHRDADRSQYLGPSHARCNTATATHAAARRRQGDTTPSRAPVHSRDW